MTQEYKTLTVHVTRNFKYAEDNTNSIFKIKLPKDHLPLSHINDGIAKSWAANIPYSIRGIDGLICLPPPCDGTVSISVKFDLE